MLLKVGELASRTGLTVRTLHHYDTMGLLKPSARSEAGYRLYNRDDIARLHAIQALRQVGMPLAEIAGLLTGEGEPLPATIQRQLLALDRQIARANELRTQLTMLQTRLTEGDEPDMSNWLSVLERMATYNRYFSAAETKVILDNWKRIETLWPPLIAKVRSVMDRGMAPEHPEVQPLARQWMDLTHLWMGGDFELMARWNRMYKQEPIVQGRNGVSVAMSQYIHKAIALRMGALRQHFTLEELSRFNVTLEKEWTALAAELDRLIKARVAPESPAAQQAVAKWNDLVDRIVNHDAELRKKLLLALASDPTLRAGAALSSKLQEYLHRAWIAGGAAPHGATQPGAALQRPASSDYCLAKDLANNNQK
ncbi:DNA-binding transcriptional MerR regulator [Paucimonas lemoignei]|uniref:DNA-binding transcriptional MerR regulator n=1 Tax=Paucimonas lemoignei TaxID=29443 RepID=A0A4R3HXD9_PAULE|nr:MerR family transcriptional regulator [Paucimonas lemoignei]TCS37842.1 DNA-binding transcriptional MerR regulator [Paucimonas lemoignei]